MRYWLFIIAVCFPLSIQALSYEDASIILDPPFPQPGEAIVATLTSPSLPILADEVTWLLDGNPLGAGEQVRFIPPSATEPLTITAQFAGRETSRTITPATVDLLWEADTYTPPFYRGRALPTQGAIVYANALPQIQGYDPASLIYQWRQDGRLLKTATGEKGSALSLPAPKLYDHYTLSVTLLDNDVALGYREVTIHAHEPELHFYTTAPLLGVLTYSAYGAPQTTTVDAAPLVLPYFFNIQSPQELTYTQTTREDSLHISARHPSILLQSAEATIVRKDTATLVPIPESDTRSPFGTPTQ